MAAIKERNGYANALHHPHLTLEECVNRYPILTRNLQDVLIGSVGEAGCVIRDYRDGFDFSCEACSHSGLTPLDRIKAAVRSDYRKMLRENRKRNGVKVLGKDRPTY